MQPAKGRRKFLLQASVLAIASPVCFALPAHSYPAQTVRVIVGFPQSGPVDIAGRLVSAWLSDAWAQPFVVENRPGDSGNAATAEVLSAPPDGYTLLLCGPVNAINTTLFPNLKFDFVRDTEAVSGMYRVPLVVEVNPSLPVRSMDALLAFAKANPGRLKVAYAGNGTPQHIGIELFKAMAGVDLSLVSYAGSAPALVDLLSGKVDMMFDPLPSSIGYIQSGKLIALGVTGPTRLRALREVPSVGEAVPGYEAGSWFGLVAPKATPAAIVDQLNAEINRALDDSMFRTRIEALGGTTLPGTPAAFRTFIERETEKYAAIIRKAHIPLQ